MQEVEVRSWPGIPMLVANLAVSLLLVWWFIDAARAGAGLEVAGAIIAFLVVLVMFAGYYMVEPNQAAVLTLFGKYIGTVRDQGLRFNNPFYTARKVSLRVRNFESGRLKVNELNGSPIEIASVIVWRVVDSAEATFNVDDYESFVQIQSEAALRSMATRYPYDQHTEGEISLRSHAQEISEHLKEQLDERLTTAGVDVIEARISHLAYASEIAQAMLQRQQAEAVVAARRRIVDGAVGMVQMALHDLKEQGIVDLDEERQAQMVSNLLVVLCSDRATQPVINTGSIHQ
ncbi:MAG TPA: SPFH domain-containing protein [Wenzhouxiangellaceae bacterium]|nr:SPFH domain-containing protein [Wenzhouxiangellaceae bacterium]